MTAPHYGTDCITARHFAAIIGIWAALWAFIDLWTVMGA